MIFQECADRTWFGILMTLFSVLFTACSCDFHAETKLNKFELNCIHFMIMDGDMHVHQLQRPRLQALQLVGSQWYSSSRQFKFEFKIWIWI